MITTTIRTTTTAPPVIAALSRRSRPQAIGPGERPCIGPALASAATGAAPASTDETSSGAAIGNFSSHHVRRAPLSALHPELREGTAVRRPLPCALGTRRA